jgi:hypothetical protein
MGRFMPRLSRFVSLALLAAALPLAGCANIVNTKAFPGLEQAGTSASAVAVVPFDARGRGGAPATEGAEFSAAPVVARQVAEAIAARGVKVIPPEDVARAMQKAGVPADAKPEQIAALAQEKFGANIMLMGQVIRFRDRRGENLGASAPASVGFNVTLYQAPTATRLWSATFDETQKPISANLFNLGRYPGGGSRWLTAEELSKWGADGVADAFPISAK